MDDHDDSHGDTGGRWLTYGEIAEARGTSKLAAVRLTQRHHWRRQKGNDGFARVFVPDDMLPTDRGDGDRDTKDTVAPTPFHTAALAALESALSALREAKDSEITTLREAVSRAEVAVQDAQRRAEAVATERDQARAEATEARQRAEAMERADRERRGKGRWTRLRAAWRGQ